MTLFHLVRHGTHVLQDRVLVGRMPGVALSERGRAEAERAGRHLADARLDRVVSSPRRRARETATAIVEATGAPCEIAPSLDEVDVGEWTGRTLDALGQDPRWQAWNAQRSTSCCPAGESMEAVWQRLRVALDALHERFPHGALALISHAEPIRVAILKATGRTYDDFMQVEVLPGSVTPLVWRSGGLSLAGANSLVAA